MATPTELFFARCEEEPVLIPLHALRFRACASEKEFAAAVIQLTERWRQQSASFTGRMQVLKAYPLLYGQRPCDLEGFFASCQSFGTDDPGGRLWHEIGLDRRSAAILGCQRALWTWKHTALAARKRMGRGLERVVQQWPEEFRGFHDASELDWLGGVLEEYRAQIERAAQLLVRTEKASSKRGRQRSSPRQHLQLQARKTLRKLAHTAESHAREGKVGAVEADLIAQFAAASVERLKALSKETDEEMETAGKPARTQAEPTPARSARKKNPVIVWSLAAIAVLALGLLVWAMTSAKGDPSDSVVKIEFAGGHGTGFLIDADRALFATNRHVVQDESGQVHRGLKVTFRDGSSYEGRLKEVHDGHDLAIVQAEEAPGAAYLPRPLALAASRPLRVGESVEVIGHPANEDFSTFETQITQIDEDEGAFRLAAPLDAGCSGAPVLDSRGQVIGVVYALGGKHNLRPVAIQIQYLDELMDEVLAQLWQ